MDKLATHVALASRRTKRIGTGARPYGMSSGPYPCLVLRNGRVVSILPCSGVKRLEGEDIRVRDWRER